MSANNFINFIKFIENTSMSKTYKIPVLLAFYNNGEMKLEIDDEDLYRSFKEFYNKGSNGFDMLKDKSTSKFKTWPKKEYVSLARKNPIHFLCKSSSDCLINCFWVIYLLILILFIQEFIQENCCVR